MSQQNTRQKQAAGATIKIPKHEIFEYAWWLKKQGYSESTILGRAKRARALKLLTKRGANLSDPESVKSAIAKQLWCDGTKDNAVDAYSSFLKMTGGKWIPPRYEKVRKYPFIPTTAEIDQLIAGCSKRMATYLQLLKETGARGLEAWSITWDDVDAVTRTVRITPRKRSNPRIFHVSRKLAAMLSAMPRIYGDKVFSNTGQKLRHHRSHFLRQRKRIAHTLKNPRLTRISFHTFRHWKGTMEYHKTKDILHVARASETEACALIDAGFEYVCDFNNHKLFRKPKR